MTRNTSLPDCSQDTAPTRVVSRKSATHAAHAREHTETKASRVTECAYLRERRERVRAQLARVLLKLLSIKAPVGDVLNRVQPAWLHIRPDRLRVATRSRSSSSQVSSSQVVPSQVKTEVNPSPAILLSDEAADPQRNTTKSRGAASCSGARKAVGGGGGGFRAKQKRVPSPYGGPQLQQR